MEQVKLRVVSPEGVEATLDCQHSQDEAGDYFTLISVSALNSPKKVYGVDPIQSFALAMHFLHELTAIKRIGTTGAFPIAGEDWRLEIDGSDTRKASQNGVKLRVIAPDQVAAVITCDHQRNETSYYTCVDDKGRKVSKKIYGIDPLQSLALAISFVEMQTRAERFKRQVAGPVAGSQWRIALDSGA